MESTVLNKEAVSKILAEAEKFLEPYRTSDNSAARFQFSPIMKYLIIGEFETAV